MSRPPLADIRRKIDALDAELCALLAARARLVADVMRAKTGDAAASPMRPERETQKLAALMAWHANAAPPFPVAGVLAMWREIIGLALAQEGGVSVVAPAEAMLAARVHFGASLAYETAGDAQQACARADVGSIAVLPLADDAVGALVRHREAGSAAVVFATLPLLGAPQAVCYGDVPLASVGDDDVTLMAHSAAVESGAPIFAGEEFTLIEHAGFAAPDAPPVDDAVYLGAYGRLPVLDAKARSDG